MSETRAADELYQSAINANNLGVSVDRRGDADAIMAAAWSDSAIGNLLLRLQAEWESAQKPMMPTPAAAAALRESMTRKGINCTLEQAMQEIWAWHANELNLFFVRLRSRRETLAQVSDWASRRGMDPAIAAPVLYWWLAPTCAHCGGHGRMKAPGTPMLSAQGCTKCKGTGKKPIPHGEAGRRFANGLDDLANVARRSMQRRLKNFS